MNISIFKGFFFLLFERLVDLLHTLIGIAYLQLFIINNFVGPKIELDNYEQPISQVVIILFNIYSFYIFHFKTTLTELLTCDGETPNSTVEHLDYLLQATHVFNTEQNKTNTHWV